MTAQGIKEQLENLFIERFGEPSHFAEMAGGGSSRRYYRITAKDGRSVVGVFGNDPTENRVFINLSRSLFTYGINVPKIFAVSSDDKFYLEEDLGNISLFNCLKADDRISRGKKALEELVKLQSLPQEAWEKSMGFPPFSDRLVRWDLNYFKYDFLKPCGIPFDEERLEDDFDKITAELASIPTPLLGFMYRDFQSRNIMVRDNQLWFIDYQGARKGPIIYDAVSFLWQAKAPFTFEEREMLSRFYSQKTAETRGLATTEVERWIMPVALFRTLQVLGAYGFRGLIERKQHFIESLPGAQRNLKYLIDKGVLDNYPALLDIGRKIVEIKFNEPTVEGKLILNVFSFSYKKGYPADRSGNGGGFMFDCRGMHNPGRYVEFKSLTGRDAEVIRFLEGKGEATVFIDRAYELVKPTVERYLERGFTSLQVGFGCTGGQHRSVYCAEGFAKKVRVDYPEVDVKLIHREQLD